MRLRHLLIFAALIAPFLVRDYTVANELKYVSIAREAIDNGTWFTFYNHGVAYADKPPLYLWIVMLSQLLFGSCQMWFVALASVLPALGTMLVMGRWVRSEEPSFGAATADLMLATTGMFLGSALVLRMDMLMTFFIVLALYTFYRLYTHRARKRERWLLPLYLFLALFTKGPVGLLAPLAAIVLFLGWKGELRSMGRYLGWRQWGLLAALCAVWFTLVWLEGGREYIDNLLIKQTVGRGINSFHHKRPFYFYLTHFPAAFAPWSLLYLALAAAGVAKRWLRSDLEKFFASAFAGTFVMLSLVSSKLDIYLLPAYPFLVYLVALWLPRAARNPWVRGAAALPPAIFALLLPAAVWAVASGRAAMWIRYENLAFVWAALGVLFAASVWALVLLARGRTARSIRWSAGGLLAMIVVATPAVEQFNPYFGLERLTERGRELAREAGTGRFAFYRFRSGENMDAYLGRAVERIDSLPQLQALERGGEPVVLFVGYKEPRREEEFGRWLEGRQAVHVGQYRVLVVGNKTQREDE